MGNFPHGGANAFMGKGRDPARVFPPASADSATDETEPGNGNNANQNAAAVDTITK